MRVNIDKHLILYCTKLIVVFNIAYTCLNQNLITHVINFAKGFESAIIVVAAILFLLISIAITLRNVKKLPKSYVIEILDLYGKKTSIDSLRQVFATHDAAESYARFYREIYGNQYKFRVVGNRNTYYNIVNTANKTK
ncbi:MAG TPA: hypothetical protein VHJ38_07585 [Nitrososphaeraceae archaeon]|nr:hypothetical protein [Nitrososphaeraceae archaeon]